MSKYQEYNHHLIRQQISLFFQIEDPNLLISTLQEPSEEQCRLFSSQDALLSDEELQINSL